MRILIAALVGVLVSGTAYARDQISIVGSSTVYPFATIVAEKFGQSSGYATPVIESTGTGGGMKLFCKGIGINTPDITNASRAIKSKEAQMCKDNGVAYQEFIVGNDGVAFANNLSGERFSISIAHIAAALVAELEGQANPLNTWADVDAYVASRTNGVRAGLPAIPVLCHGSGQRMSSQRCQTYFCQLLALQL